MSQEILSSSLGTTPLFDVDIRDPKQAQELIIRLTQKINTIILALNEKDTGWYFLTEVINGQIYFQDPALAALTPQQSIGRQVFRLVINFGALPNAGLKSVPHGLIPTALWTFTHIYATASDTTGFGYIPIPYASSTLANNIELSVDAVNVNIRTGINRTNFNFCYVVLEFLQN